MGPRTLHFWQKYAPLGKYLSIRNYFDHPNLMNRPLLNHPVQKISLGGCFISILLENGQVYGQGENYKGQLGVQNVKFQHEFEQVIVNTKEKIVDIANGLQHSLILSSSGVIYGSGRANWNQILPSNQVNNKKNQIYIDFYKDSQRMEIDKEIVKKISCGFHHSACLTKSNKIFCFGMNNHGQCGASNLSKISVDYYHQVYTHNHDQIMDIVCGKSHTVYYTINNQVYAFGAANYNQLAIKSQYDFDTCSPQLVPLPLAKGETIIKIKAKFDRTCVITNEGNAYIWGGEDLRKYGGQYHSQIENIRDEIGHEYKIKDVGLGYLHTIINCSK